MVELCQLLKMAINYQLLCLQHEDALSDKERAFVSGTDDYVTKPFEIKNYYLEFVPFCVVIKLIQNKIEIGNVSLNDEFMEVSVESKNESSY